MNFKELDNELKLKKYMRYRRDVIGSQLMRDLNEMKLADEGKIFDIDSDFKFVEVEMSLEDYHDMLDENLTQFKIL
jgi:hypothetical protein